MIKPSRFLILPAVFFTAFSSIFIRWITAPALAIAFYRMVITICLLGPYVLVRHGKEFLVFSRKQKFLSWGSGLFLALHFASWIASLSYTSIAASTVLVSCSPLFVFGYELWRQKKRPYWSLFVVLSVAIFGTILITIGGWNLPNSLTGNLLAFFGGICMAGYLLLGSEVQKGASFWPYILHVYSASVVFLGILMPVSRTSFASVDLRDLFLILCMSVFCSILGHTLYNYLLRFYGASIISLATLCEPIFASILALFLLREIPTFYTIMGGILVLLSVNYAILRNPS